MLTSSGTSSVVMTASLSDLAQMEPEMWREVMSGIRQSVEEKRMARLADMGRSSLATISRLLNDGQDPSALLPASQRELLRARMTSLAIDQFMVAFTSSHERLPLRDQLLLRFMILRRLDAGQSLTLSAFQGVWSRLKNQAAAAAAVQKAGFWSIPTRELCLGLKEYIKDRDVLEVGCGRGLFVAGLRDVGVSITGVDDLSWASARKVLAKAAPFVYEQSAKEALLARKPSVVLSVWPPPGNQFERDIFATKTVDLYIAIVSAHQFASGDWREYKRQQENPRGFSCVMNESLNKMSRPAESDQRCLIFNRKAR